MDNIVQGLSTSVIGIGIVMSILAMIAFMVWLMGRILASNDTSGKTGSAKADTQKQNAAPVVPVVASAPAAQSADSPEIIAAIMAAISASTGIPANKLVVRSIKRSDEWLKHSQYL